MKILIADDDLISRQLLERTLIKNNHKVIAAVDGVSAWKELRNNIPDVAILDWMMPGLDGPELIRKIREEEFDSYIYTILLTARTDKKDVIQGIDSGADDYLTKPFDKNELLARIRSGERIVSLEKTLALKNQQLEKAHRNISLVYERMKRDLEAAAEIQKTLLPQHTPDVSGLTIEWFYQPCDELAGDILNIFKLNDRFLGFYMLDVSGHGVSAALTSVTLSRILTPSGDRSSILTKTNRKTGIPEIISPRTVAAELNRRFAIDVECGQYFTLIYGILDVETLEMRFISAGHPSPILLRDNSFKSSYQAGLPIGFLDEEEYKEHMLQLIPGDRIYFYTDGVTEAMNENDIQFTEEGLRRALLETGKQTLKQSLKFSVSQATSWANQRLTDDISMLALEIT